MHQPLTNDGKGREVCGQIPKIFHFVIPNGALSNQFIGITSARNAHPDWEVRIWNDSTEVPNGTLNKYLLKCKSIAERAKLIALEAVLKEGGVYLDNGMHVLRRLDPLVQSVSFFVTSEDGHSPSDEVFGAAPNHPGIRSLVEFLEQNEPDWALPPNVTTGAVLFGKMLRWRSDVCIFPREAFFPHREEDPIRRPNALSYCERAPAPSETRQESATNHTARTTPTALQMRKVVGRLARSALRPVVGAVRRVVGQPNIPRTLPSYTVAEKIVVSTMHGHQLVADGTDYSLTPRLVRDGCIEFASERFLSKAIEGGDWFIDVGANIGVFSLIAAEKCGPFGRVFAFEPNPSMAHLLMEGAALNFFHDRISVRKIAISNSTGKKKLHVHKNRPGDARLADQVPGQVLGSDGAFARTQEYLPEAVILEVEANKLDDLFPIDVPIKVIKIDVEGHEGDVFAGAERLLKVKAFKYVMVEVIVEAGAGVGRWKNTLGWLTKLLEFGYDVCTPNGEGNLVRHPSIGLAIEQMTEQNLVFSAREGA